MTAKEKEEVLYLIRYEVYSSLWAGYGSWEWLQSLTAKYYAWKTMRKWKRMHRLLPKSSDLLEQLRQRAIEVESTIEKLEKAKFVSQKTMKLTIDV